MHERIVATARERTGADASGVFNYRQPEEIAAWAEALCADCRIVDGYMYQDFTVALTR